VNSEQLAIRHECVSNRLKEYRIHSASSKKRNKFRTPEVFSTQMKHTHSTLYSLLFTVYCSLFTVYSSLFTPNKLLNHGGGGGQGDAIAGAAAGPLSPGQESADSIQIFGQGAGTVDRV